MWLLKSEPESYSWDQMVTDQTTRWDGVRNYQAAKNLRLMKKGDRCFFYHSGKERQIIGLVQVSKTAYPDPSDSRFVCIDVTVVQPLPHPITLAAIKTEPRLQHLALVRQPRLSVMPIDPDSEAFLLKMGQI